MRGVESSLLTYASFAFCGLVCFQVPDSLSTALEAVKDNDEAVKSFGVHLGTQMCQRILDAGIPFLHLYTLNMEKSALAILQVCHEP